MGVFAKNTLAAILAAPWRAGTGSSATDAGAAGHHDHRASVTTRMTEWDHYPSSSVLREDLEAIRRRP